MKFNIFTSIIAILMASLLSYAVYSIAGEGESHVIPLVCFSLISFIATFLGLIGVSLGNTRQTINIRILSLIFGAGFIAEYLGFAMCGVKQSFLIIMSGILFLTYILIAYIISKSSM